MNNTAQPARDGRHPGVACRRLLAGLMVLGTLNLAGCGEPYEEPTVTRSDAQAQQLRERLVHGQGAQ